MRKILIVVDMQNDFVDGALGTPEAQQIVPAVAKKIRSYPKEDVIYTLDTHGEDYMNTQEGKNLPVVHCVRGTQGWMLNPVVDELSKGSYRFEKPTFGSVLLGETLKSIADKEELELELVGLCTDICVVSNALLLKAMMPEVPISVDACCCAGVTPESHAHALATMKACQIHVTGE